MVLITVCVVRLWIQPLKYVLSFLTSDEAQQYYRFYISVNGTDKSTCGKTANSTCKSLKYVLGIYYNRDKSLQHGLSIITSKSLIINQELMVSPTFFIVLDSQLFAFFLIWIKECVSHGVNNFRFTTQSL